MVTLGYQVIKILTLINYKYMTKFQFHVLIALCFLIVAESATGFRFHIYWFLVYLFTIFALFDCYKIEQNKFFSEKNIK